MKKNEIMLISIVTSLAVIYTILFFFFPKLTIDWAFIPEKVFSGEWWRLLTYQFVHLNEAHLFENVISAALLGFIAVELNARWDELSLVYFVSGMLAIFPVFLISQFTALGASTAIYGGFGFLSQELAQFKIKPIYIIILLTLFVFLRGGIKIFSCGICDESIFLLRQGAAHFSGLMIGVALYKALYVPLSKNMRGVLYGNYTKKG